MILLQPANGIRLSMSLTLSRLYFSTSARALVIIIDFRADVKSADADGRYMVRFECVEVTSVSDATINQLDSR